MSVREAAERLLMQMEPWPGYCDGDQHNDAVKVSTAYLADHPADECEPITDEWLREIGFVDGNMPGDLTLSPVVRGISTRSGEYWVVRSYPLPYVPKTRGQLRKLLEALGVKKKGGSRC